MSIVVGVLNYGVAGNIFNIVKALRYIGVDVRVLEKPEDFKGIDKLVLPGVGSFYDAIKEIDKACLRDIIIQTAKQKDTLGICLGMQLLVETGYEFGLSKGLGLIEGEVKKIQSHSLLPHIGFNSVNIKDNSTLFKNMEHSQDFYFMHSFEVLNEQNVLATTKYGDYKFVSSVQKENIYGVQFHPEKSRDAGLQIFKNFIEL